MLSLKNKRILITGGTGSFGQCCTRIILQECEPETIAIYSRGEILQQQMRQTFADDRLRFIIGDIRDLNRLHRAAVGANIIIHSAALKMIPEGESNPTEFIRTNIEGSANVIDVAIDCKVQRVVAISTDKACHPANLYGATKMIMEKLFIQANEYSDTKFSCSRYGNVVDARGEILSTFLQQKETGVLTITDERMNRWWLTVEQGVRFVISCIDRMQGGEVFIPKSIPSARIIDLAKAIAPEATIKIIGIRPGEKLGEELITVEESRHAREFDDYYIIEPELASLKKSWGGKPLEDGFAWTSSGNGWWLSIEELREMIFS